MSKLLALLATLRASPIVIAVTFAATGTFPVSLISLLVNLAELGAKPVGQTVPRDIIILSSNHSSRQPPGGRS